MAEAVSTQERALVAATCAGRRHQQIEQAIHEQMLEQAAARRLPRPCTAGDAAPASDEPVIAGSSRHGDRRVSFGP
jgi:hypothetical protein